VGLSGVTEVRIPPKVFLRRDLAIVGRVWPREGQAPPGGTRGEYRGGGACTDGPSLVWCWAEAEGRLGNAIVVSAVPCLR
jgi:hypothetical protein